MLSVIMNSYKRKDLTLRTLWGYTHMCKDTPVEIILIDDRSPVGTDITEEDLLPFKGRIKITLMKLSPPKNTFGIGFLNNAAVNLAQGSHIVITNSENILMTNNLYESVIKIKDDQYQSMGCQSLSKNFTTTQMNKYDFSHEYMMSWLNENVPYCPLPCEKDEFGWRQHSEYRFCHNHFFVALTKKTYINIGGFEESKPYLDCDWTSDNFWSWKVKDYIIGEEWRTHPDFERMSHPNMLYDNSVVCCHQWHPCNLEWDLSHIHAPAEEELRLLQENIGYTQNKGEFGKDWGLIPEDGRIVHV